MQEKEDAKISKEDIEVLNFLSRFKMLKVEDASLIYKTKRYYRERVNKLIARGFVKRYKKYIILDKKGRKELGITGSSYIKNADNESYMERLKYIASIATITINSNIEFIPSWEIKDKNIFTDTARRYIGKMIIESEEYIVYFLSSKKQHVYIKQVMCDINKVINYRNIIIFVDDINIINKKYAYMAFNKENTYIIQNSYENKEIIKQCNKIDLHEIMQYIYKRELLISNWEMADYLLGQNQYIVNMLFINTEKIEKLNWYYTENTNTTKEVQVITLEENKEKIQEMLTSKCKIITFDKKILGGISETQFFEEDTK